MAAQQNNNAQTVPVSTIPLVTTTPAGITTNVSATKPYIEYYQRFVTLNPTADLLPNGDGTIRISPFDDYIIFTLYDETSEIRPSTESQQETVGTENVTNSTDTPIDLSNVGTLTLVFVGENDEIRIPNWTQVQDVDLAQGQVLFRIDKESSKKILALDNNNFYVSTRMEDVNGVSDESVLYTGTFLGLTDATQQSMTAKINAQSALYAKELATKDFVINSFKVNQALLLETIEELNNTIISLQESNITLTNEIEVLNEKLGSTSSELAMEEARNAQLLADRARKKRRQIQSLNESAKQRKTGARKRRFWQQASKANQEFNTASNPVEQGPNRPS